MKIFSNVVCSALIGEMLIFVNSHQSGCNRTEDELETGPTIDRYRCKTARARLPVGCEGESSHRQKEASRVLRGTHPSKFAESSGEARHRRRNCVRRNVKLGNGEPLFVDKTAQLWRRLPLRRSCITSRESVSRRVVQPRTTVQAESSVGPEWFSEILRVLGRLNLWLPITAV